MDLDLTISAFAVPGRSDCGATGNRIDPPGELSVPDHSGLRSPDILDSQAAGKIRADRMSRSYGDPVKCRWVRVVCRFYCRGAEPIPVIDGLCRR